MALEVGHIEREVRDVSSSKDKRKEMIEVGVCHAEGYLQNDWQIKECLIHSSIW